MPVRPRGSSSAVITLSPIRLACDEDADQIAQMSRTLIENGLGWSWNSARVLAAIRDASTNVALVSERERIAGFGIMHYGEQTAHLALLGVSADYRRRGIATQLLEWLERCADTAGIGLIRVEARADNPDAITFYERQKYQPVGTIAGYYRGRVDAVRLEKRLWVCAAPE